MWQNRREDTVLSQYLQFEKDVHYSGNIYLGTRFFMDYVWKGKVKQIPLNDGLLFLQDCGNKYEGYLISSERTKFSMDVFDKPVTFTFVSQNSNRPKTIAEKILLENGFVNNRNRREIIIGDAKTQKRYSSEKCLLHLEEEGFVFTKMEMKDTIMVNELFSRVFMIHDPYIWPDYDLVDWSGIIGANDGFVIRNQSGRVIASCILPSSFRGGAIAVDEEYRGNNLGGVIQFLAYHVEKDASRQRLWVLDSDRDSNYNIMMNMGAMPTGRMSKQYIWGGI